MASSYISLDFAPNVVNHPLIQGWLSGDMLMHLWLAPYRIYCLGVQSNGCVIAGGENGIPHYLLLSRWLADFGNNQNMLVQFMMGIPLLVVLGCVFALEASVGPSMVPLLLAIVTVFIFRFQADVKNKAQSGKKRV